MVIGRKHSTRARGERGERGGEGRSQRGFTILELLIVLAIIIVLTIIAVPTFLTGTHGASDAVAKDRARQALTSQKVFRAGNGEWGQAADLQAEQPSIKVADLGEQGVKVLDAVYIKVDGEVATLVSRSATGTCYWVRQPSDGTATYAKAPCGTTPADTAFKDSW